MHISSLFLGKAKSFFIVNNGKNKSKLKYKNARRFTSCVKSGKIKIYEVQNILGRNQV